jgi:hypothetical protein
VAQQARPARDGCGHQLGVEDRARHHAVRSRAGALDHLPTGTAQAHPRHGRPEPGHAGHAKRLDQVEGVGGDPVAAGLVARELRGVDQQHAGLRAQLQRAQGGSAAGGARAHDRQVDHVVHATGSTRPRQVTAPPGRLRCVVMVEQRRGRRIAMSPAEVDAFLAEERTCRVATVGPNGPHATPLWYAWHGGALWLTSVVRSQRWTDLQRDPRVAVVVDAGTSYDELRGVELRGRVEVVGEVPRTGEPVPELEGPEQLMADRYLGGTFVHDGRHAWLRLVPDKITSWDFRKLGG